MPVHPVNPSHPAPIGTRHWNRTASSWAVFSRQWPLSQEWRPFGYKGLGAPPSNFLALACVEELRNVIL